MQTLPPHPVPPAIPKIQSARDRKCRKAAASNDVAALKIFSLTRRSINPYLKNVDFMPIG
jgi:hypothetical protein